FQPFRVFLVVAALYFVICYPLSQLSRWMERRLHA
ncbi:MAG TPA: amino acid ABC transporter permease, partial [Devosia sp.]|nr:amino acid ABC transporter permease [Devosia sp.]